MLLSRLSLALTLIAVVPASPAAAGAFGISMGDQVDVLGAKPTDDAMMFAVQPPKPHPEFKSYVVYATPPTGVCKVAAATSPFDADPHGVSAKARFAEIEDQLKAVYGKDRKADDVEPGSIWAEPRNFVMSVLTGQRTYGAEWSAASGAKLKDGLKSIDLGLGKWQGGVALFIYYTFSNWDACQAEKAKTGAGAL